MAQIQEKRLGEGGAMLDSSMPRYILLFGTITSLFLITYFSIASVFDFKEIEELRYLNIFLLFGGIFLANHYYHRDDSHITNYLNGAVLGFGTSVFAGIVFSVFLYLFMRFAAPEFGLNVQNAIPFRYVSLEMVGLIAFLETIVSGFVATFVAMQYYKNVKAD